MAELDLTQVTRIAVDETSSRRGHRYITLFVDVDTKRILFATEGKGKDTRARFKQHLLQKGVEATQTLKDSHLKTGKAYRLKLAMQEVWITPHIFADVYLREWMSWATRSQLQPMVDLAKTVKRHEEGILRWFHSRMTNGLLEGINGLVQASKRRTRGYRNVDNLIAMVYMVANKMRMPSLVARRSENCVSPLPFYTRL
ncbi:ISL3 family transposase [Paenibacillus sp. NPDC055715]